MLGDADASRDTEAREAARKTEEREEEERGGARRREREKERERKSLVCVRVTLYHEAIAQVGTRPP